MTVAVSDKYYKKNKAEFKEIENDGLVFVI